MPKLKIETIPLKTKNIYPKITELLRHYNKLTLIVENDNSLVIVCQKKLRRVRNIE
jgi:hypothetical protein